MITEIAISQIKEDENFLKRISKRDFKYIDKLAYSIRDNGQKKPIVCRLELSGLKLLSGVRRLLACRRLRKETIKAYIIRK